jgi:hypothetical protein
VVIDGRQLEERKLLMKLRDAFASREDLDVSVDVLLPDRALVSRVRAFSSMTGFSTVVEERAEHVVVHITGGSCRCG